MASGKAKKSAKQRLTNNRKREKTQKAIRLVWQKMLSKPDKSLCHLLAKRVESKNWTKTELKDVENFLKERSSHPTTTAPGSGPSITKPPRQQLQPQSRNTKLVGYILRGESVETGSARGTLASLLERFDLEDSEFMESLYQDPKNSAKSIKLVAREEYDLHKSGSPNAPKQLKNGWWIEQTRSRENIRKQIEIACKVAGVEFDTKLKLIER